MKHLFCNHNLMACLTVMQSGFCIYLYMSPNNQLTLYTFSFSPLFSFVCIIKVIDCWLHDWFAAPLHYPEFVTVFSNGPDSVRVSWRGISTSRLEASVQGYKVCSLAILYIGEYLILSHETILATVPSELNILSYKTTVQGFVVWWYGVYNSLWWCGT